MKKETSIQRRVYKGYYICIIFIVLVAISNYLNLSKIESNLSNNIVISKLFNSILEIRRFEKNYFLYSDETSRFETLKYIEIAETTIEENSNNFEALKINKDIFSLKDILKEYKENIQNLSMVNNSKEKANIRELGRNLVITAENITYIMRQEVIKLLSFSKKFLVSSIYFLIIIAIIVGQYLSYLVLKPLKNLHTSMKNIVDGNYGELAIQSSDKEIIALNSAFNKMFKELEQKQMNFIAQSERLASLGKMVSGVAHQLNNPISNISSSCQILKEEIESSDIEYKKELLFQIEDQIERTQNIVYSILEFSKRKKIKKHSINLKKLMQETVNLMKVYIPNNLKLETDIADELYIYADKQKVEQVFLNLIKNSVDALKDTKDARISIFTEKDSENKIKVVVQDNGPGISHENVAKVFSPFFTTKVDDKGSGLGLFIAKEIIKEHNGEIAFESNTEEGTKFIIKLPLS